MSDPTSNPSASTPTPAAAGLAALSFVLRERPGANKPDEALVASGPIEVPLPGGGTASMTPAWYDLIGDLQLRLVRETADSVLAAHASDLAERGWTPEQALAVALADLERRCGAPAAHPWHNLQAVKGQSGDVDSLYFLDRAFWRRTLATHPDGLVVAVPRTDALLFAPAADTAAVASLRRGVAGLHAGGGDYRLSSALYLFKDDRWTVFQPAVAVAAADADADA